MANVDGRDLQAKGSETYEVGNCVLGVVEEIVKISGICKQRSEASSYKMREYKTDERNEVFIINFLH